MSDWGERRPGRRAAGRLRPRYSIWYERNGGCVSRSRLQRRDPGRRVVASYPEDAGEILLSGYLKGAKRLAKRAAVVDLTVGKGRVILIGFRAQHRAQPHRTFKLLWNALYLPGLEEVN